MDDLRTAVWNGLKNKKASKYYKSTGWMATKCPHCDNMYDKKAHLSIQLIDGRPIIATCFRATCNVGGIVNRAFGKSLGLPDDVCDALEEESLRYHKYTTVTKYYSNKDDFQLGKVDPVVNEYFTSRTGKDLYEYQDKLRIATDMRDFLKVNHLSIPQVYPLIKWENSGAKFIYFFNSTYSVVHYREVYGKNRRGKMTLVKGTTKELIKHKPYFIENNDNIHKGMNDMLVLAEGPFDIINSFLYVLNEKATYVAAGGQANMRSIIFEYTKYHYRARIHIVSDSDVDISWYKRYLLPKIKPRVSELVVYYNKNGKDVGDIKDGINIKKITLLLYNKEKEEELLD